MLTPSILSLASRQAEIFLKDRLYSTREDVRRVEEQHAARGNLNSATAQEALIRVLRAELIARFLFTWDVYKRLIPGDQAGSGELSAQLKGEVTRAVDSSLDDMKQFYAHIVSLAPGTSGMPQVEELYIEAREKMEVAVDELCLTRAAEVAAAQPARNHAPSVFVNCPFDSEYSQLFRAMIFTIVDCGFSPRCSLEADDSADVRIQRIYRIIGECRLSVHDISRTQLDKRSGLPRFNMPLELGIFLGARALGADEQQRKACLVFDEQPYRYQAYLSDVAGQDIGWHENEPRIMVRRLRDWLSAHTELVLPTGGVVWDHYVTFQGELRDACDRARHRVDELTYRDLVRHISAFREGYVETLNIRQKNTIKNPSAAEIRRAIRSLIAGTEDPFLILQKGANGLTYLQAAVKQAEEWVIEFQDGHLDKHFVGATLLDTNSVVAAFLAYADGDESWRTCVTWQQMEI